MSAKIRSLKKKDPEKKDQVVGVGIAYYRQEDWDRLIECSEDRDEMDASWEEWHQAYLNARKGLKKAGIPIQRVVVDIDELIAYCQKEGIKNTGSSRSQFVSLKLKETSR